MAQLRDEVEGIAQLQDLLRTQVVGLEERVARAQIEADGIAIRLRHNGELMSYLRREFRTPDWLDLDKLAEEVASVLSSAEEQHEHVVASAGMRDWPAAFAAIDALERLLGEASTAAALPGSRLNRLRELRANPDGALQPVQFALRDAQMMVMTLPPEQRAPHVVELDLLVELLADVSKDLEGGASPSYRDLGERLHTVTTRVAIVVSSVREARRR